VKEKALHLRNMTKTQKIIIISLANIKQKVIFYFLPLTEKTTISTISLFIYCTEEWNLSSFRLLNYTTTSMI